MVLSFFYTLLSVVESRVLTCVLDTMKSFLGSGFLALISASSIAQAVSIPHPTIKTAKSGTIDLHRDAKALEAAIARQTNGTGTQKRSVFGPDPVSYAGYWFADITIDGQNNIKALLDTGSADLWIYSPSTRDDAQGNTIWDPSQGSHTTLMSGQKFDIGYGTGGNDVTGPVYQAPVCVGEICVYMAVGSVTGQTNFANDFSGILGLAFQGGNSVRPNQQPTFLESLVGALDQPIMSWSLTTDGGQIAFGNVPFGYTAPFQQITVDKSSNARYPYSWSATDIQYTVNGKNLGTFDVVFDTGGPMMSASESIVRGYYAQVQGARDVHGDATSWTAPCGSNLPDMRLNFNNGAFLVVPGKKFFAGNTATSGDCTVWLVRENSANRAVIGDPFFDEHVVVFNQNTGSIQWANKA